MQILPEGMKLLKSTPQKPATTIVKSEPTPSPQRKSVKRKKPEEKERRKKKKADADAPQDESQVFLYAPKKPSSKKRPTKKRKTVKATGQVISAEE